MSREKVEEKGSQLPMVAMLMTLGWDYLPSEEVKKLRGGNLREVILDSVLERAMLRLNHKSIGGKLYAVSLETIQKSIRRLKTIDLTEGLFKCNSDVTDLLIDGDTQREKLGGIEQAHNIAYIDWQNPHNNTYHCTTEFDVDGLDGQSRRPDIVLFVNGIPMSVIECKGYGVSFEESIAQQLQNQNKNEIPQLFAYAQILAATGSGDARYGTVGTPRKFWSEWKVLDNAKRKEIQGCVNTSLSTEQSARLLSGKYAEHTLDYTRTLSPQDVLTYAIFPPATFIRMMRWFTLFDAGKKKVARYQQYEVIENALIRLSEVKDNQRRGGVVWHTQGSGKSLTMLMLARMIPEEFKKFKEVKDLHPQIILVTDRVDLHNQLKAVFLNCSQKVEGASTGKKLRELIQNNTDIIMTLVHKFESAMRDDHDVIQAGNNVFVLVDEGHRTQNGDLAAMMRRTLPNASYVGFTGTPLIGEKRNSFYAFDNLILPSYSIKQAVADKAVVPLLYQGVKLNFTLKDELINTWMDQHCQTMDAEAKARFQAKYSQSRLIQRAEHISEAVVLDINEHYMHNWKGSGFKAQMVVETKALAVKCKKMFDAIGDLNTQVIISGPGGKYSPNDGDDEDPQETTPDDIEVVKNFWKEMLDKHHSEKSYNDNIIESFSKEDGVDILIVVSKLLTGFDESRNTTLYLCKALKGHTLLQAIARVNRLCEGKDYGYIVDYSNTLGELNQALNMYNALDCYNADDIAESLVSIHEICKLLPQLHKQMIAPFKNVQNRSDKEAFVEVLTPVDIRDEFFDNFNKFARSFGIVCCTTTFLRNTSTYDINTYRTALKFYHEIRAAARNRYAQKEESFTKVIQKLLDENIGVKEVARLGKPIDIFKNLESVKEGKVVGASSKKSIAEMIARQTLRYVEDHLKLNPIFYKKYADILKRLIDDYQNKQNADYRKYLSDAQKYHHEVITEENNHVPESIRGNKNASAYFETTKDEILKHVNSTNISDDVFAEIALECEHLLEKYCCVDFWKNKVVRNKIIDDLSDYLYDEVNFTLTDPQIITLIGALLDIAESRGVNND